MAFDEMEQALRQARNTMQLADAHASTMARALIGRLRHVDSAWVLADLKKELQKFNRHTGRWSE